jgi:hypothetical protein
MRHRAHAARRLPRRFHGVAFAWACRPCRDQSGIDGREYAPGRYALGAIHAAHVPELTAAGWEVATYPGEPPDVVCPHYADLCAAADESPAAS